MFKKVRKQSKESVGVPLARLIEGFTKGITGLLGLAANLDAQGKDEYLRQIEITGRTKDGKEIKGRCGLHVKVGLPVRSQEAKEDENPEDFSAKGGSAFGGRGQKKLPDGS